MIYPSQHLAHAAQSLQPRPLRGHAQPARYYQDEHGQLWGYGQDAGTDPTADPTQDQGQSQGQSQGQQAAPAAQPNAPASSASSPYTTLIEVGSLAGTGLGAYHSYKRNHGSIGWAIGWSIFGALMPILAIPIMLAEGFGKPEK